MRAAGGGIRLSAEWLLRSILIAALLGAIWAALHVLRQPVFEGQRGGSAAIRSALRRWSTVQTLASAHVGFDSIPSPDVRDWISALSVAGTPTTWDSRSLSPVALAVEPVADPRRLLRIWLAAPAGSRVSLRDSLDLLDSLLIVRSGAVVTPTFAEGVISASAGRAAATAVLRDSLHLRPVLILGAAGWESGFATGALEELGWKVDARIAIRPKADVIQGSPSTPIDTAHYSAVIALDSSAARYAPAIIEYVRAGGGLIVAGNASRTSALSPLMPGAAGSLLPEGIFATDTLHPRDALALLPLTKMKSDAVVLEWGRGRIAAAARRYQNGRVLQIGYVDMWRWQMGGPRDPVREYQNWLGAAVSSVAYAPRVPLAGAAETEAMPLPALVDALGPPVEDTARSGSFIIDPRLTAALFIVLMMALPAEVVSRRLRGKA